MNGRTADSFTSIHDAPLHHTGGRGKGKDAAELAAPPDAVLQEIDQQELNRMFVRRYALLQDQCVCSNVIGIASCYSFIAMWVS